MWSPAGQACKTRELDAVALREGLSHNYMYPHPLPGGDRCPASSSFCPGLFLHLIIASNSSPTKIGKKVNHLARSRKEKKRTMSTSAVCVLMSNQGVKGTLTFKQVSASETQVTGTVEGLTPGLHGFHIHQFGDTTNGCASCGGHFNPDGKNHGGPLDEDRHAGDLGNILANASGVASVKIVDGQIPLSGPRSILGRAVVVHAGEDDLGKGGNAESLKTGNAGARAACGIVAASPDSASL